MFVELKRKYLIKVCGNIKIVIFASIRRNFFPGFPHSFFKIIRLATRAACSFTGLFLFIQAAIKSLRNIVFIPVNLIKKANQEDWLRSLAYFVRLKSLYVNNTHYGFNLRGLSKKLKCSPACLSVHLKVLRSRGLVADHSGNITFRGLAKISELYGPKPIGVPVDHENQLDLLRAQLIRFNLSCQKYNIKRSGIQKCPANDTPNTFLEKASSCYSGLSAKGFGKILGLSASQGAALRSKMIELGVLSAVRRYSIYLASGGPSGEAPSGRVLRTALIQGKRQGFYPSYAFIRNGKILAERRMELEYQRA